MWTVEPRSCRFCNIVKGEHYLWCHENPYRGKKGYILPRDQTLGTLVPLGITLTVTNDKGKMVRGVRYNCCRPRYGLVCYACLTKSS